MESEIIETVLAEVLEELKNLEQQQAELVKGLSALTGRVETFDQKLSNIKVSAPPVNTMPIELTLADGIDKIARTIEAQPKSVVKQFRVLLFPEYNAGEYYRLVFGRVLFWVMILVAATYLLSLGRQFINNWSYLKEQEMAANHYRKVWQVLYKQESNSGKRKMDSVWRKYGSLSHIT